MLFETDGARWSAITKRDEAADGHFIYAVKTTGIFCRPNCKARLARRANVSFFSNIGEAVSAGFRACKRCKPEMLSSHDPQKELARKAVELIKERVNEMQLSSSKEKQLDLKSIAKELGWTVSHFHHVFKNRMGITPKEFARSLEKQDPSTETVPSVNPISGNDGANNLSEWTWFQAPHVDSHDRRLNGQEVEANLEQLNQNGLDIERSLLESGEELIDWDSVLLGLAS
jgi:methylphosphotriester-DNA--protein-cysteine methyltransferase